MKELTCKFYLTFPKLIRTQVLGKKETRVILNCRFFEKSSNSKGSLIE